MLSFRFIDNFYNFFCNVKARRFLSFKMHLALYSTSDITHWDITLQIALLTINFNKKIEELENILIYFPIRDRKYPTGFPAYKNS